AEYGWGITDIIVEGEGKFRSDISASYLLVSRRLANGRVSLRGDVYSVNDNDDYAITAAYFWSPRGRLRTGVEAIVAGEESRIAVELRYNFSK
ncbi:MAG TPA: hypothetical protein VF215_09520, partial [Thermoanaerobaculia bacterium]